MYRRRRWVRRRSGESPGCIIAGINAFYHSQSEHFQGKIEKEKREKAFSIAVQMEGGRWTQTSAIPPLGTVFGALRVTSTRWPRLGRAGHAPSMRDFSVFELCYSVSALDGEWGEFTRLMLVTSRFLVRNDSRRMYFEVKQSGADDSTAVKVAPGETSPFHWSDFRLPELICIRPVLLNGRVPAYRWSGGFDPLSIGATPLRLRRAASSGILRAESTNAVWHVRSVKVESEIRTRTGRTGINLSLQEEDRFGSGSLFRVENHAHFPIWISQDGLLANFPSGDGRGSTDTEGDIILHNESLPFALDVPFRQGKYAGRKAATIAELLRARVALAPLSSRAGIETTKVISMTIIGERVRLNPSKLTVFTSETRSLLSRVRVLGLLLNDGPTRVLRFW